MRSRFFSHIVAVATVLFALSGTAAAQPCPGDCNGDGVVTINELIIGVNLALGEEALYCPALDLDENGEVTVNELIAAVNAALGGCSGLQFLHPTQDLAVQAGTVAVRLAVAGLDPGGLVLTLDGADVSDAARVEGGEVRADLVVAAGDHRLEAEIDGASAAVDFTAIALTNPEECEILNDAICLLPYPSSRFLVEDPTTATGYRVQIPDSGLPQGRGTPVTAEHLNVLDGFSPTVQILMHLPQGVDLARSGAAHLLAPGCCEQPPGPPWIDTRTATDRSLDADSPTILLRDTGERVLHWLEPDARAAGMPERQALILRPGASLVPGGRYIVALRNLQTADGSPVVAEPAFAALRDGQETDIPALAARRAHMEEIFAVLDAHGVGREELVLAFDFVVQSEDQLTRQMLSMRDQAFAWLADVEADAEEIPFTVTNVVERDCEAAGAVVWRDVTGTFRSPLFLTASPNQAGAPQLNVDGDDVPVQNGFYDARLNVSIPCSTRLAGGPVAHPIVLGHGLFGTGQSMTALVPARAAQVVPWTYIAGATDWRGLSQPDLSFVAGNIVGLGESQLHNFPALPDRLRQGMLDTLVLGRLMKRGILNRDPAFQRADASGVFPGPDAEMFYYGISLGGIMGTWYAALTPDVQRFGVDVPAINFSCLLQRSTQFNAYDALLDGIGITDPLDKLLGLQLLHELWVSAEPAGYARHITADTLPGTGEAKHILMTPAWLDKQVSNQCTEIAARTLGLSNLVPGSLQRALPGIPDADGPLSSAYVMYDSGAFDLFEALHQPFIPPLANVIPSGVCDPHGARPATPAGTEQLFAFLRPDGVVENFCNGDCDAGDPSEIANGAEEPCDPLN